MQGRTGKIVLAVLGVILMIIFILPGSMQSLPGADPRLGMIGDEPVRQSDVLRSSNIFDYASNNILVPVGEQQFASLTEVIFQNYERRLSEDTELFHLLLEEAERSGATMPREPLESQLVMGGVVVIIPDRAAPNGRRQVAFADLPGEQLREQVLAAAGPILSIDRSLGMHADYARVSAPLVDYFIAIQNQRADLRTVVFDAEKYLDQAPQPAPEAMAEHFEKYKDNLAGRTPPQNPFGFGYRRPDRVKLQYITISGEAVREHVVSGLAEKPVSDREAAIYAYWDENRARFPVPPTTQPATQPATQLAPEQPATQPATQPTASNGLEVSDGDGGMLPSEQPQAEPAGAVQPPAASGPTTQPMTQPTTEPEPAEKPLLSASSEVKQFLEDQAARSGGSSAEADWKSYMAVHDQVVQRFVSQHAGELRVNISKRLRDVLTSDYRAFDLAGDATTRPRTRVGTPLGELEYLDRVADAIAAEFGVRPRVSTYARDYLSFEQLQEEAQVGEIAMAFAPAELQMTMFANYAFGSALDLLDGEARERVKQSGAGLSVLQPSQPMMDLVGNEHIFRLIEAQPAAAPAAIADVEEKVREDLRRLAAYELALEQAGQLAEQARASFLEAAAQAAGLTVHDPLPFAPGAGVADVKALGAKENENITMAARSDLADSFYRMISDPALAGVERPIGVLPMRPAFRVIVAQLDGLVAGWNDQGGMAQLRERRQQELRQQLMSVASPAEDFFNFDRVARRIGYVPKHPRTPAATQP